jgi:hypothetical protein
MPTLDPGTTFDLMERDSEWLGYGYLGARRNELDSSDPEHTPRPEFVAEVDRRVLEHARRGGWTQRELFDWANSKLGRWLGDATFGSVGEFTDEKWDRCVRDGLLEKVDA